MENQITHDEANKEFILSLENDLKAIVSYTLEGRKMRLVYSEVPTSLRGEGVGKELVEKTFQKLTDEGFEAIAVCSYIRVIAMRSPKWSEIIDV
jgi:predicted GNAT family acetyltransferase